MPEDMEDVRDKPYLNQKDILGLNFIRTPAIYLFRRHYREGLRSHIMEVLAPEDVSKETKGILVDGLTYYPRAKPLKMFRIFRMRFNTLKDAKAELERVRIVATYLSPAYMAQSQEFLVDYDRYGKRELLLCGLQEYVQGEVLDPWGPLDQSHLLALFCDMGFKKQEDFLRITNRWIHALREKAEGFIGRVKQMIMEANHVPDLAGVGNLILTRSGAIKLVDINNISRVTFDPTIHLDDRGYPVGDKSIEALCLLEEKLLGRPIHKGDLIYKTFLDPERMKDVKAAEEVFYLSMETLTSRSGLSQLGPHSSQASEDTESIIHGGSDGKTD
jgi:hypothetical protein